jgi:[ribosomal protein S5]-alanine N-acetyltransferase
MPTHNIILKPIELSDAPAFALAANYFNIAQYLTDKFPHPYTLADAEKFIIGMASLRPANVMGIFVNGVISGAIGLHLQDDVHRLNAELGYWLTPTLQRQGIMSYCVPQMLAYGFNTFIIHKIFARVYSNNKASLGLLLKCGFVQEGYLHQNAIKNGQILNEHLLGYINPKAGDITVQ